jgi:Uma2 family endonuclease
LRFLKPAKINIMVVEEKPLAARRHKFTYEDVMVMAENGLFDHVRVELRNGELIEMSPQRAPHAINMSELTEMMISVFIKRAKVVSQVPLRLSPDMKDINLPNPDVMLLRHKRYRSHPLPEDVFLIIEISDSTLKDDLGDKLHDYAKAGIPEYWVYDVKAKVFKVHLEPSNGDYNRRVTYPHDEAFAPQAFPEDKHVWLPDPL